MDMLNIYLDPQTSATLHHAILYGRYGFALMSIKDGRAFDKNAALMSFSRSLCRINTLEENPLD